MVRVVKAGLSAINKYQSSHTFRVSDLPAHLENFPLLHLAANLPTARYASKA